MNPPLEPLSGDMYHELMEEIRHIRRRLDSHVDDEKGELKGLRQEIGKVREDIATLKAKMGFIAAGVSALVAAVTAWASKVFF